MRRDIGYWASESSGSIVGPWFEISGTIRRLESLPSTDYAPTSNYDVTLETKTGEDLLQGLGANRSATAAEHREIYVATTDGYTFPKFGGQVRFKITNAGAYKSGIVAVVTT